MSKEAFIDVITSDDLIWGTMNNDRHDLKRQINHRDLTHRTMSQQKRERPIGWVYDRER